MKSPFIGMNPWLEGYMWADVHGALAHLIVEMLAHQIAPKYIARNEMATKIDAHPEFELGIMYPDVEILEYKTINIASEPTVAYGNSQITAPSFIKPFKGEFKYQHYEIHIKDTKDNRLVTAIEIVSPANKRGKNLDEYRDKIKKLHKNGVNVLEIDLLRRGQRSFEYETVAPSHYRMTLLRAGKSHAELWNVDVKDALPVLPIPLLPPDADVPLDLGKAFEILFERRLYQLSINYSELPPPPKFSESDWDWIQSVIKNE